MKHRFILIGLVIGIGLGCAGLLMGLMAHRAQAMPTILIWQQVNTNGFGDNMIKQLPSLAVFGDYLYAGAWHYDETGNHTAQIWRTSTGVNWEMVDIRLVDGTAAMIPFKGFLYAGSWDGHIWSSTNGTTWTEIVTNGFDGSGQGIARFAVYNDTLYASTWYTGTEIWRTSNGMAWEPFVENGLGTLNNNGAIASETFNEQLYWGVDNKVTGAQLWRTNGTTTTAIITNGFGNAQNKSISSLAVFGNSLYAGLYNSNGVQVWRSANGIDWEPIDCEFGNPYTVEESGMEVYDGQLYLAVRNNKTGMEVWSTSNGTDWEREGFGGFGDANNQWSYWDNAMTVFKGKLYVATNNWPTGGEIWRLTDGFVSFLPVLRK